uniref:ATP synthase subunit gamma n=1 Tax=Dunaliella tertiolecta TaxID=3047 RepID=A0A7S3RAQ1_DUNTE|mmetsp:Transcript_18591/g.52261  ORF Transcript_18591/g.52261 Transcript_18591/m.52261 type:complete len:340 (+) Transcript_18591:46-1065(+)
MALRRAAGLLASRVLGTPSAGLECAAPYALQHLEGIPSSLQASTPATPSTEQVRHAGNLAVKQRIRAIKNIGKITKAMKMVAASKMKNAQIAVENSRGSVDPFLRLFGDHPAVTAPKTATVAVTSDKGLCGGLNSNISKYTRMMLQLNQSTGETVSEQTVASIGDKGRSQLTRTHGDIYTLSVMDAFKPINFAQASLIAEELLKQNPEAEVFRILYNKFVSAIAFKPTVATVMMPNVMERQATEPTGNKLDTYDMEVPAENKDALQDLAEFQLAMTLHNAMLENNCSEHASRMSAMENSTKSAGEMLSALTLSYNRKRQAAITTELTEIIAGASALEDQ